MPPPGQTNPPTAGSVRYSRADVTDFGEAMAALSMIDERVEKVAGVVHLAAIPAPGQAANHVTFAAPNISPTNAAFGTIASQSNSPRYIQLGARLVW